MEDKSGREALRGAEVDTLDLIFEALTSEQLATLLTAPLKRAAAKGETDLAQRLVGAGAQIGDAQHAAGQGGHGEIVSDLLENGASLAAKNADGRTPLHIAAHHEKTEMVQLLLLKGAEIDAFDNNQFTPLYTAACHGHLASTLAFLAAGADVNRGNGAYNNTVMLIANLLGHVEILRAAIEHGADVDAVNQDNTAALHVATVHNHAEAIDMLVEAGANIDARARNTFTPLHYASGSLNCVSLLCLLRHGANVNAQTNSLETPLLLAAHKAGKQGAAEVVDALLRAGADETMVDNEGNKAGDVIGRLVEEENRLVEDIERVSELLANAPADRAWRRQGYLVMCRAHPDRVQQNLVIRGTHHTGVARRTRGRAKLARAEGTAGNSTVDGGTGGDWAVVAAKVLQSQEEGIFRTIVEYL